MQWFLRSGNGTAVGCRHATRNGREQVMTCTRTHRKRRVAAWAVLAAAMLSLSSAALRAAPPTAADGREAVAWCKIRRLRADLHLSTDDLAALACSKTQAETVLSPLGSTRDLVSVAAKHPRHDCV